LTIYEGIGHLEWLLKEGEKGSDDSSDLVENMSRISDLLTSLSDSNQGPDLQIQTSNSPRSFIAKLRRKNLQSSLTKNHSNTKSVRVSRAVPKQFQTLSRPKSSQPEESLTEKYLMRNFRYRQFIESRFTTPYHFERVVVATITKIESETIDPVERWLDDLPASAFWHLQNFSVDDLLLFSDQSYDEIIYDLQARNIKYETFVVWRDKIDEMTELVLNGNRMTLGELFSRWIIEKQMVDGK